MNKFIKWFFVITFLVTANLFAFGVIEPDAVGSTVIFLCFAYLAYKTDVKVTVK